jgi:hypothetical protein
LGKAESQQCLRTIIVTDELDIHLILSPADHHDFFSPF